MPGAISGRRRRVKPWKILQSEVATVAAARRSLFDPSVRLPLMSFTAGLAKAECHRRHGKSQLTRLKIDVMMVCNLFRKFILPSLGAMPKLNEDAMSRTAVEKTRPGSESDLRISEDMQQQLKSIRSSRSRIGRAKRPAGLTVVTFDSDLENAVPDPVVMWSKATCC